MVELVGALKTEEGSNEEELIPLACAEVDDTVDEEVVTPFIIWDVDELILIQISKSQHEVIKHRKHNNFRKEKKEAGEEKEKEGGRTIIRIDTHKQTSNRRIVIVKL